MTSFKESGNIEYAASWLGILAAVEDDGYTLKNDWERIINHDGNIDLIVFKAKRGTVLPALRLEPDCIGTDQKLWVAAANEESAACREDLRL